MFFVAPPIFGGRGTSLINEIKNEGLESGLKLCLDAGDINSWPGSGQLWKDLSGNGNHFYLGGGSGADGADPTFNGTPGGLSQNEYFSVAGGDYFTLAQANPQWVKDLFRVGSASFFVMLRIPTDANLHIFATEDGTTTHYGGSMKYASDFGKSEGFVFVNSGGSSGYGVLGVGIDAPTFPGLYGLAIATTIASNGDWQVAGSVNDSSGGPPGPPSAGTVPDTHDPTQTAKIFANGNASQTAASGARIYCLAVWQGVAIDPDASAHMFSMMRNRFGL